MAVDALHQICQLKIFRGNYLLIVNRLAKHRRSKSMLVLEFEGDAMPGNGGGQSFLLSLLFLFIYNAEFFDESPVWSEEFAWDRVWCRNRTDSDKNVFDGRNGKDVSAISFGISLTWNCIFNVFDLWSLSDDTCHQYLNGRADGVRQMHSIRGGIIRLHCLKLRACGGWIGRSRPGSEYSGTGMDN